MLSRSLFSRVSNVAAAIQATHTPRTVIAAVGLLGTLSTLSVLTAATAHAQTYTPFISDLTQSSAGLTMFTTTSDRLAQSFTTSAAYSSLLYARLNLALQSTTISTSDTVHLYLYSDGYGTVLAGNMYVQNLHQPVSPLVADLGTVNVNSATAGTYTFSSSSKISLSANTQYWIVLQDDANSNAGWSYTTSTTYTGPATVNASAATGSSPDAGNSWLINALTYTDPTSQQVVNYGEQLFEFGTATAALPEPGALPFLGAGLIGPALLLTTRRRNQKYLRDSKRQ